VKALSFCLGVGVAVLVVTPGALAQNYPWCSSFHDGAGTNCGFSSYEQCMATAQGSGGTCTRNNVYVPSAGSPGPRRAARKRRPGGQF
jgi:hypothetical protein